MKKLISFLLLLLIPFTLVGNVNLTVDASGQVLSPYVNKLEDVITRQYLEGGVLLEKQIVETVRFGNLSDNVWLDQTFQWVTMPASNDAIKTVVWSKGTAHEWKAATVRTTALDFETKNPGWIVVAAVNGDFFDINATYQPSAVYVQNGDVLKSDSNRAVIGFKNDGTYIYGVPKASPYMMLSIYKDDLEKAQITSVNKQPTTGITLLTTALSSSIDLSGYTVYVGNYTLNRITPNGHFVKGAISEIKNDFGIINNIPLGKFYLVSKDASFESKLTINTSLKCEYELTEDFAQIPMTMGTSHQIVTNGQTQYQGVTNTDDAFIGTAHPRTVLGFKSDGTVVLMVIDGRKPGEQKNGASLFEAGELLRLQGVENGYNLDGGGSSTLLIRNDAGNFEVINTPSDNSERSIGNAVLFVMQDPKIQLTNITGSTMKFEQTGPLASGVIENISAQVGGKTYPFVDGKLEVSGLLKNTTYNVTYNYTIIDEDGKVNNCKSKVYKITTLAQDIPVIKEFVQYSVQNLGVTIKYNYEDKGKDVKRAYIAYEGKEFELPRLSGRAAITGLTKDKEYEFKLILELNNDDVIESDILNFTAVSKSTTSTGCQTGSTIPVISMIFALGLALFILKRKE